MLTKKSLSLLLVITMLIAMIIVPVTLASAETNDEIVPTGDNTTAYGLAEKTADGNILQAFNWKATEIAEHAQEIAEAGYTTVQISPMQTTKQTKNAGAFATDWWCFYQPIKMDIGNALGTKAEIGQMCDELHKYGVKVIADVVTNHSMGIVAKSKTESNEIKKQLDNELFSYYRSAPSSNQTNIAGDGTRQSQVQGNLDGELPDFNTSSSAFQNSVINKILIPYMNLGIDGFRFDAAKHIETPDDGAYASQYWPNVTNAIKSKNRDAYIYGEILASAGKFNISSYTKYMSVTDYSYGDRVRSALNSSNASSLVNYGYDGSAKDKNVIWVESHDTFCANTSTSLSKAKQIVGWAAIGARKDAPALYFPRPACEKLDGPGYIKYDEYMGYPGTATTWKEKSVAEVNKFKNYFVGQSENVAANGSMLFVQRGTTGMVISNLAAKSASVNQSCSMKDGTYKDQVSGKNFTVKSGKITGTIGSTGVAVIYNRETETPSLTVKAGSQTLKLNTMTNDPENRYTADSVEISIDGSNTAQLKVKVANLEEKTFKSSSTKFTLNSSIAYGKSIPITITASSSDGTTATFYYKVHKKNANENKMVYFDNTATNWFYSTNNAAVTGEDRVYCFQKKGPGSNDGIAAFPGTKMTLVSGKLYRCQVASNTKYVKFSEGQIPQNGPHLGHSFSDCGGYCGRTMPYTVIPYGTANSAANRQNGGYELVGSMICKNLKWYDYGDYPEASLSSSDVTFDEPQTKPTEPPTQGKTEPSSEKPTVPSGTLILGDSDLNKNVDIADATLIQQFLAKIKDLNADQKLCADVDGDTKVSIADATYIQQYLVKLPVKFDINKPIGGEIVTPTQESSKAPSTEPSTNYEEPPTEPDPTGTVVTVNLNGAFSTAQAIYLYEEGSGNYPGTEMTKSGSYYTAEAGPDCYQYRVVGYYGEGGEGGMVTIQTSPIDVSPSPYKIETYTIKCTESWNQAYVHMWSLDGSGAGTEWPGVKMTGSSKNFSLVIPNNAPYAKYKFNSGLNGSESAEYSFSWYHTDSSVLYCDFGTNPSNPCAYFWKTGGGEYAKWPGTPMENVSGTIYKIEVPSEYDMIIFNYNNGGSKTDDLSIPGSDMIYNFNSRNWSSY